MDTQATDFKAGFVSFIGLPNAGKSTLLNAMLGQTLSITSPKAQTTRHRIFGIVTEPSYQIVYSDTPGYLNNPKHELHRAMLRFITDSLSDADALVYLADINQEPAVNQLVEIVMGSHTPLLLVLNKIDLVDEATLAERTKAWQELLPHAVHTVPISALNPEEAPKLLELLLPFMPVHPPYFPEGDLSDRNERFFASEIIREKIFLNYGEEIPYSTEVIIIDFKDKMTKEGEEMAVIQAEIWVERPSQRPILIGEGGKALKRVGMQARKDLEAMLERKVFLETHVKVVPNWRSQPVVLRRLGYQA